MIDFSASDPRLLDDIDVVVEALVSEVGLDPNVVMLIGATCRDVLHSALGHRFIVRATRDTDIGIALTNWDVYHRIASAFASVGDTGVAYRVAGLHVDILPFGAVEEPEGIVAPMRRGEDLVVFGFEDVYESAGHLTFPAGATIRIPQPAGYAALKLRAWIDRSAYGQDKDGRDIATAMYWYQESEAIKSRLWETSEGQRLLEELNWDVDLAAARLLGHDALAQLTARNAEDLRTRWTDVSIPRLVRAADLPAGVPWPQDAKRRAALLAELTNGIARS